MEMRLGKTKTCIEILIEKDCNKILVAGRSSFMRKSWEKDLSQMGESFVRAYGTSTKEKKEVVEEAMSRKERVWILTNYETFQRWPELIFLPVDAVIADESTKLKDPKTKVTKLFVAGFRAVKHRVILTGLIAPEHHLNLFMQFVFLQGKFMGEKNYWKFRNKYFEPAKYGYGWVPKKGTADAIRYYLHQIGFVLTAKQAGLNGSKIKVTRSVQMNSKQDKLYRQIEREFAYEYGGKFDDTEMATGRDLWLHRVAGGFTPDGTECISNAKPEELLYLLENDFANKQMLIWYRLRAELAYDAAFLKSKGISVTCLYGTIKEHHLEAVRKAGLPLPFKPGKMTLDEAQRNEEVFSSGNRRALLVMEKLGAWGKDFSAADVAVFRSQEYSNEIRSQAELRTFSVKKGGDIFLIDLVCEGTVDEDQSELMSEKIFDSRSLLSRTQNRARAFTK